MGIRNAPNVTVTPGDYIIPLIPGNEPLMRLTASD